MSKPAEMQKVVFAADCEECAECGEPWCERHREHYADCPCIGPTEEDVAYQEIDGVLYGRRVAKKKTAAPDA